MGKEKICHAGSGAATYPESIKSLILSFQNSGD
jgi:hypothetical protein